MSEANAMREVLVFSREVLRVYDSAGTEVARVDMAEGVVEVRGSVLVTRNMHENGRDLAVWRDMEHERWARLVCQAADAVDRSGGDAL